MESVKNVFIKIRRIYWGYINCTDLYIAISYAQGLIKSQPNDVIYPVLLVWSDGRGLLYTSPRPPLPSDVLPLHMFFNFTEGTMTSLYPGGQWVSKSFWHHVSVNTIISTSLIDFMNSGFPLFHSKVEEWRPWILQQLIWNECIKKQSKWTCIVRQILKHLQLSIHL